MAEVVRLFRDGSFRIGVGQHQLSASDPEQARHQSQKRGFPGAIRPRHQQGFAAGDGKAQAGEDLPPPRTQPSSLASSRMGAVLGARQGTVLGTVLGAGASSHYWPEAL